MLTKRVSRSRRSTKLQLRTGLDDQRVYIEPDQKKPSRDRSATTANRKIASADPGQGLDFQLSKRLLQ